MPRRSPPVQPARRRIRRRPGLRGQHRRRAQGGPTDRPRPTDPGPPAQDRSPARNGLRSASASPPARRLPQRSGPPPACPGRSRRSPRDRTHRRRMCRRLNRMHWPGTVAPRHRRALRPVPGPRPAEPPSRDFWNVPWVGRQSPRPTPRSRRRAAPRIDRHQETLAPGHDRVGRARPARSDRSWAWPERPHAAPSPGRLDTPRSRVTGKRLPGGRWPEAPAGSPRSSGGDGPARPRGHRDRPRRRRMDRRAHRLGLAPSSER